ncbi:hypothetical protein CYMTET_29728 [Cymbomonas tetramitiformis]|uniref:Uncharacterized protein n=1 Tax=Cymbomonas tetramitiformis TaxID=36881 RepID=A0AAE0KUV6_9CHLO|nr:hypothetical protein CYMTET_29728 [Cymbomonas tetramitiformis]
MSEQVNPTEEEPEGSEIEGEELPFEFSIVDTLARLGKERSAMSDALLEHEPDGDVRDTWALAYAAADGWPIRSTRWTRKTDALCDDRNILVC